MLMTKVMFSLESYESEVSALFKRFPSVQNVPFGEAYKPGLERMLQFSGLLGNPERQYRIIHVAGTNGKGSVSNMTASALGANGFRTGLFTSPHISDFRERMRIIDPDGHPEMVPKEWVYDFIMTYKADFEELSLSFFEITTGMALKWFADCGVDYVVLEVGLGGRLDSTNIVTPCLSVITSIGLDHCDLLGDTLEKIAGEKAGIIKPGVPVVIGESRPETRPVFLETAASNGSRIVFSEDSEPWLWARKDMIVSNMDLQGHYQEKNLRTVLTLLPMLGISPDEERTVAAIEHTAERMDFHGRWEKLCSDPLTICDIGHNAHALRNNFSQLAAMGHPLIIVYAIMADKDFDSILPLMPENAVYIFTAPSTSRALPASQILSRFTQFRGSGVSAEVREDARDAVRYAMDLSRTQDFRDAVIYIGGSSYLVSEVIPFFRDGAFTGDN